MPVVTQRPRARDDLAEIWDYIADDSEARADAFIDTVNDKFRMLAGHPGMGRLRDELRPSLRSFPVGRYIIFYLPLPDGVDIVRVLHSARDIVPGMLDDE